MLLVTILLIFITGVLILWLLDQYKYLNIFETLGFGFGIGLSLFVFELYIEDILFGKISLIAPILTCIILSSIFIYKAIRDVSYLRAIRESVLDTFHGIKKTWGEYRVIKKAAFLAIFLYIVGKIFLSFMINVSMPTYDEDAVNGWDMKTKVFLENRSLILDSQNPEFLGSALDRNIFAPLTDTYFLLGYVDFPNGLSNIISPLIYLSLILCFFGILLRKTHLTYAIIGPYIFASLPFVFIHSFGSYFNYISGYFLFIFAFYLSDQIFRLEKDAPINYKILIPLSVFAFLDASIRNESLLLMSAIIAIECILFFIFRKKEISRKLILSLGIILIGPIIAYTSNIYINSLSIHKIGDVTSNLSGGVFSRLMENIALPGVLTAPLSQSFYHPDYNLLYLLYALSIVFFIWNFRNMKSYYSLFFSSLVLLGIFTLILFINVESLGLLTHFSFVRYPIAIIPFVVYVVAVSLYRFFSPYTSGK